MLRRLALAGLMGLAGCAGTGSSQDPVGDFFGRLFTTPAVEVAPPSPPAAPSRPATARAAAPAPAADPPARKSTKRAPPAPEGQTAAVAAPAPADVAPAPPRLIGLTQTETVSLLGAPAAQFDRPPAKVWHYQGPDCALDVFFYLDLSRNEFSALRYTAAGGEGASAGSQCLTRIRDAQRK